MCFKHRSVQPSTTMPGKHNLKFVHKHASLIPESFQTVKGNQFCNRHVNCPCYLWPDVSLQSISFITHGQWAYCGNCQSNLENQSLVCKCCHFFFYRILSRSQRESFSVWCSTRNGRICSWQPSVMCVCTICWSRNWPRKLQPTVNGCPAWPYILEV